MTKRETKRLRRQLQTRRRLHRLETLQRLRRWYRQTLNPLYAWEAIARCLINDNPPLIPDWCLDYLRSAAINLTNLSFGTDFRTHHRVSADQAIELAAAALSLSRQGKLNAFAALLKDRDAVRDANTVDFFGAGRLQEIAGRRNISKDRAQRIIKKGRRLQSGR
jgi:hypothetical protein